MEFRELYFLKSFCCIGESRKLCYGCDFCRARGKGAMQYSLPPGTLNPLFSDLPVVVNLFHGDPMLYPESTRVHLDTLEAAVHTGPVVVITKGDIRRNGLGIIRSRGLDLHFGLSYFGDRRFDCVGTAHMLDRNLKALRSLPDPNVTCNIEYRPIIRDINDGDGNMREVFEIASEYKVPVAYSGLQVDESLAERIKARNLPFRPYDGYEFGMKKNLPPEIEDRIRGFSAKYGVPVFRKTSCAISYCTGMGRDYNAHYYRPNEMGCSGCPMHAKCSAFKEALDRGGRVPDCAGKLPFGLEPVHKEHHRCRLHGEGLCKFPSDDCLDINGVMFHTDRKITTADVRVVKWLTGCTVDADFTESPFVSTDWFDDGTLETLGYNI